jgi:hypothetical protein
MAGPTVIDPQRARTPQFTTRTGEDTQVALGIMRVVHSEPLSSAFARLISGRLQAADKVPLAHFFEEVSVLRNHGHIADDLLFDMFALDPYWDALKTEIEAVRKRTKNPKFAENFEIAAKVARDYRRASPTKLS